MYAALVPPADVATSVGLIPRARRGRAAFHLQSLRLHLPAAACCADLTGPVRRSGHVHYRFHGRPGGGRCWFQAQRFPVGLAILGTSRRRSGSSSAQRVAHMAGVDHGLTDRLALLQCVLGDSGRSLVADRAVEA